MSKRPAPKCTICMSAVHRASQCPIRPGRVPRETTAKTESRK